METNNDISRIIKYFKGRDEVSALYVFGAFCKGTVTGESDIDIAVLINEKKFDKVNYERLRRTYYTASPKFSLRPVDIVILNTAPTFLKFQVIKTGKILFDRNRRLRVRFTAKAITEYLDFKPLQDILLKGVTERFRRAGIGR